MMRTIELVPLPAHDRGAWYGETMAAGVCENGAGCEWHVVLDGSDMGWTLAWCRHANGDTASEYYSARMYLGHGRVWNLGAPRTLDGLCRALSRRWNSNLTGTTYRVSRPAAPVMPGTY